MNIIIGIAKFLDIYNFTIATVKSNADTVIILLSDKSSVVVAWLVLQNV